MATMTLQHAKGMTKEMKAGALFALDQDVRKYVTDENTFETWLALGVPDGMETIEDFLDFDFSDEDFVEIWNLAEKLVNKDMRKKRKLG